MDSSTAIRSCHYRCRWRSVEAALSGWRYNDRDLPLTNASNC
ncbi:hypothetical protein AAZX31_14G053100 [Glycine max]